MKKIYLLTVAAVLITLLAASCGQNAPKPTTSNSEATAEQAAEAPQQEVAPIDEPNATVYAVGMEIVSSREFYATIWIDGKPTRLSNKTGSSANSVVVTDDNTVYVAGMTDGNATLWTIKNNKTTALSLEKKGKYYSERQGEYYETNSVGESVFVTPNGEVYVCGMNNAGGSEGKIWKISGTEITSQTLSEMEECESASVNSLHVTSNGDIYAAGFQCTYSRQWFATLWKNGEMTLLSEKGSDASGIKVTPKGDIYVVGEASLSDNYTFGKAAVIWKNKTLQPLTTANAETSADAKDIFITENGDIYVAGYETTNQTNAHNATIWKNGQKQTIQPDANKASLNTIYVTPGNNVYVGGYNDSKATIWKNGNPQTLTNGYVYGVFVK